MKKLVSKEELEALQINWGEFILNPWPIGLLVLRKALAKGYRRRDVASRMGCKQLGKSYTDLDGCVQGERHTRELRERLMKVLDILPEEFEAARETSREVCREMEREEAYRREVAERACFKPHAWVIPERRCPSPIFVVAFCGENVFRRVDLPGDIALRSEAEQFGLVGAAIREHYLEKKGSAGPFGKIMGYLYRQTYDDTIEFSVEGEVVRRNAPRPGINLCSLSIGNKAIVNAPDGSLSIQAVQKDSRR